MNLAELRSHVPLVNKPKQKKGKKAIPKVAKKRRAKNAEYSKLRAEFLAKHRWCQWWLAENSFTEADVSCRDFGGCFASKAGACDEVGPIPWSEEVHHIKGRGKYFLDVSTWLAVSSEGHRAIHADPKRSYERGYMQPRR